MAYSSWSAVANEQPSASKWNILGTNDAYFDTYIDKTGYVIQRVGNSTTAVATGTTTTPLDDTIPQSTEGDQYMTQAITPTASASILVVEFTGVFGNTVSNSNITVALFQDATANAVAAVGQNIANSGSPFSISLKHTMTAGTTSSTTFKIRAGANTASTTTFNGISAARLYSTITKSVLTITELR